MKTIGILAAFAISAFSFLPANAASVRVKVQIQTPTCHGTCTTGGTIGAAAATNGTDPTGAASANSWESSKSWLNTSPSGVEAAVKAKSNQQATATGDGATVAVGGMTAVGSGGN